MYSYFWRRYLSCNLPCFNYGYGHNYCISSGLDTPSLILYVWLYSSVWDLNRHDLRLYKTFSSQTIPICSFIFEGEKGFIFKTERSSERVCQLCILILLFWRRRKEFQKLAHRVALLIAFCFCQTHSLYILSPFIFIFFCFNLLLLCFSFLGLFKVYLKFFGLRGKFWWLERCFSYMFWSFVTPSMADKSCRWMEKVMTCALLQSPINLYFDRVFKVVPLWGSNLTSVGNSCHGVRVAFWRSRDEPFSQQILEIAGLVILATHLEIARWLVFAGHY